MGFPSTSVPFCRPKPAMYGAKKVRVAELVVVSSPLASTAPDPLSAVNAKLFAVLTVIICFPFKMAAVIAPPKPVAPAMLTTSPTTRALAAPL